MVMAIMAGLVGAYVVRNSLLKPPVVVSKAPPPVIIPLATSDLPAGRQIAMGDIALVSMSPAMMEERGFAGMQTMLAPEQIIGRIAKDAVRQGQPFLTTNLYLEGTRHDFTGDLRPGYRAYSLVVAKDKGGALPAGAMVDVLFRTTEKKANSPSERGIPEVTLQLVTAVEVIDVFNPPAPTSTRGAGLDLRTISAPALINPTVTLAVTPEQAHKLQAASGRGEITLMARPENERNVAVNYRPTSLNDILGIEPPPQVVVFATEAYRAGSRSVNVYRNDKLAEELSTQPAPRPTPPPADPLDDPLSNSPPMNPAPVAPTVIPVPVPVPVPVVPGIPGQGLPRAVPLPGVPGVIPPARVP